MSFLTSLKWAAFGLSLISSLATLFWVLPPTTKVFLPRDEASQHRRANEDRPAPRFSSPWRYQCVQGRCLRQDAASSDQPELSLNTCKLTCGLHGVLWPRPINTHLHQQVVQFLPKNVNKKVANCVGEVCHLLDAAFQIFHENLEKYHPSFCQGRAPWTGPWDPATMAHELEVNIIVAEADIHLSLHTDESYQLHVTTVGSMTTAILSAKTYFGARHGLETLSQLVEYHETSDALLLVSAANITDAPAFTYRGLLLDTSRNFYSVAALERTLDTMAANKLNTLHWHITDTQSFPLYLDSLPQLAQYGAYSPRQVYYPDDVRHLVHYARVRGIRLLPELDAPAHTDSGWQFGEKEGLGKLVICNEPKNWELYCDAPMCGHLNLANPNIYSVLSRIYKEMVQIFSPVELFHFGGDEISLMCWKRTKEIIDWMMRNNHRITTATFYQQWGEFQEKARQLLMEANGGKEVLGILWTSKLTNPAIIRDYVNNSRYVIQIWTSSQNKAIGELLKMNYKVIFSNHDAWYLDCGIGSWMKPDSNWCSPYKDWRQVYDNDPLTIATYHTGSPYNHLILGGEAALWSESAGEGTLDAKLWPRGAALAERLWTNPNNGWEAAETRLVHQRERLARRGVQAETVQPQWCHQNEGYCRG